MQTTCARKHNEPCQDNYLAVTLTVVFHKQADKMNMEHVLAIVVKTKASSLIRLIKNQYNLLKLPQF